MTWRSSTSNIWKVIHEYDLAADIGCIPDRIPFLCLHGDRDDCTPLHRMRELESLLPTASSEYAPAPRTSCRFSIRHGCESRSCRSSPHDFVSNDDQPTD